MNQDIDLLLYGVEEIFGRQDLESRLNSQEKLRIKLGFDPTSPDLHFGHLVVINKLKQFQDLGHQVICLIGDFTAMIGDPSGKNVTRPILSKSDVEKNAETYTKQVFKILDPNKTIVEFNSTWMSKFSPQDIVSLTSKYTVARMLERDDFSKRYKNGLPISIHEFIYPLIQAYDSVALRADVELGGTDQKFNLLLGREIQRDYKIRPQTIMTMPILEGLDGKNKMSKSLNNYISIQDNHNEMFGKIMSISDNMMMKYIKILTDVNFSNSCEAKIKQNVNPKDIKVEFGKKMVSMFYDKLLAKKSAQDFENRFKKKLIPTEISEKEIFFTDNILLSVIMKKSGMTKSTSEAIQLIKQSAVKIDEKKILDSKKSFISDSNFLLQVGKRKIKQIILKKKDLTVDIKTS